MYTAIKGTYENGQIILEETPPNDKKASEVVMFLTEEQIAAKPAHRGAKIGSLAGKRFSIPDVLTSRLMTLRITCGELPYQHADFNLDIGDAEQISSTSKRYLRQGKNFCQPD
jgi:hypothetical protein